MKALILAFKSATHYIVNKDWKEGCSIGFGIYGSA
jgi:hypothetical protein